MSKLGLILCTVAIAVLNGAGCAQDIFVSMEPVIEVTPYESDTTLYADINVASRTINLGDVPVYDVKKALFRIDNRTTAPLLINDIAYLDQSGGNWQPAVAAADHGGESCTGSTPTVAGGGHCIIEVAFAPAAEGNASAELRISSNASNSGESTINILASGVYHGQPILQLGYMEQNSIIDESDCIAGDCVITDDRALDIGRVGLGLNVTSRFTFRNLAECEPHPGGDACSPCTLRIGDLATGAAGLSFKEGTNDTGCVDAVTGEEKGCFELVGDGTFEVQQTDVDCEQTGAEDALIAFQAPDEEGTHEAVLLIETNDPEQSHIEVPLRAVARNAPLAIATGRECQSLDPVSGELMLTDCHTNLEPLARVFFDGRTSCDPTVGAFNGDPSDPEQCDRSGIVNYRWEVIEAPEGVNPNDYDWRGQNSGMSSFWLPLAGHYVVKLIVTNDSGIDSSAVDIRGDNGEVLYTSTVEFDVVPESLVHIQLVWDNPRNDQDLHLTYVDEDTRLCHSQYDCYYANQSPVWFPDTPAGEGGNPRLDVDDTNGLGPENVNIDAPRPGTYRIYVHYYPFSGSPNAPTVETVRVYLHGILRFSESRTLTHKKQVWAVGDIVWTDDGSEFGTGEVIPYPSDQPNQVGAVAGGLSDNKCNHRNGWNFPN